MPKPEIIQAVNRWLEFADGDLRSAQAHLEHSDLPPRVACFLSQQAAEKAIKAALVWLEADFPKSHDIEELVAMLPSGWKIKSHILSLAWLSEWAVEGRYPGDLPDATQDDAKNSVELADFALRSIIIDLIERGYRGK